MPGAPTSSQGMSEVFAFHEGHLCGDSGGNAHGGWSGLGPIVAAGDVFVVRGWSVDVSDQDGGLYLDVVLGDFE